MDSNPIITYGFRFASSDQLIHLTQQQIDLIPYLSALMAHKNNFLSIENENGEYVLNEPIKYSPFMAILHFTSSQNPYILFDELPEDENVLHMLQLFDYLGLASFPLPLLKAVDLVRSKAAETEDENYSVEYFKANLSEARQTAGAFVLAVANNEYNLRDSNTKNTIFDLINIILFNSAVFSLRFRYHTLKIAQRRCSLFFSKGQNRQLQSSYRIVQSRKSSNFTYLSDDNQSLPEKFQNTFSWRGVYVPVKDINRIDSVSETPIDTTERNDFSSFFRTIQRMELIDHIWYSEMILSMPSWEYEPIFVIPLRYQNEQPTNEIKQNREIWEARAARSGHFNTLPKRPKIDKFKHRCGPKVKKYR